MPRDANGNYTLPAGNPVVAGTTIDTSWANPTMEDIANEITNSLSRDGEGGMLVPFLNIDGSVGQPGMSWLNQANTGFYRAGASDMRASIGGVDNFRWDATGAYVWNTVDLVWDKVADSGTLADYLPLAGGTMTGDIITELNGSLNARIGELWTSKAGSVVAETIADANVNPANGFIRFQASTPNAPTTAACVGFNTVYDANYQTQIVTSSGSGILYLRNRISGTWGPWLAIAGGNQTPSGSESLDPTVNFNTLTTPGYFYVAIAPSGTGKPAGGAGALLVQRAANSSYSQTYFNNTTGVVQNRSSDNGATWSAWTTVASTAYVDAVLLAVANNLADQLEAQLTVTIDRVALANSI